MLWAGTLPPAAVVAVHMWPLLWKVKVTEKLQKFSVDLFAPAGPSDLSSRVVRRLGQDREQAPAVPGCPDVMVRLVFTNNICTSGSGETCWHSWLSEVNHPCLFLSTVLKKEQGLVYTGGLVLTMPV